ncbi:MAG: Ser-Thr-rich GPI-anchored membrane family protein [Promethearchaeota archaeon]
MRNKYKNRRPISQLIFTIILGVIIILWLLTNPETALPVEEALQQNTNGMEGYFYNNEQVREISANPRSLQSEYNNISNNTWVYYEYYLISGDIVHWNFTSDKNYIGITVLAMNFTEYTIFAGGDTVYPYWLSDGSYYSDSGSWTVPYADTWNILFWNRDDDQEATYVTTSVTIEYNEPITITSPSTSSKWEKGQNYTITWTPTNVSDQVAIGLLEGENGTLISNIAYGIENDGEFDWFIKPHLESRSDYYIYIFSLNDYDEVWGFSDYFEISDSSIPSPIKVIYPSNSTTWEAGTIRTIEWTTNESIDYVDIWLYKGADEFRYIDLEVRNIDSYDWGIPSDIEAGTDYRLGIYNSNDTKIWGLTDYFEIKEFQVKIWFQFPTPVSAWRAGATYVISFLANIQLGNVTIELYKGDTLYMEIAANIDGSKTYSWEIPTDTPEGDDYRIKVILKEDNTIWSTSDEFRIIAAFKTSITDSDEQISLIEEIPSFSQIITLCALVLIVIKRKKPRRKFRFID